MTTAHTVVVPDDRASPVLVDNRLLWRALGPPGGPSSVHDAPLAVPAVRRVLDTGRVGRPATGPARRESAPRPASRAPRPRVRRPVPRVRRPVSRVPGPASGAPRPGPCVRRPASARPASRAPLSVHDAPLVQPDGRRFVDTQRMGEAARGPGRRGPARPGPARRGPARRGPARVRRAGRRRARWWCGDARRSAWSR